MINKDLIYKISAAAKAQNQNVQTKVFEVARNRKSAINSYLQACGIFPNSNPHTAAMQAGKCIYSELGPNAAQTLETLLDLPVGRVPKEFEKFRFYDMLKSNSGAFWAALLAFEESPANQTQNTALKQVANFEGTYASGGASQGGTAQTGQTSADQIKGYIDAANEAAKTAGKVAEAWSNFKEWSGWGSKRFTTNRPIYYFWKNGANQPNEGKLPVVEQASVGWIKDKYEKDLQGDLGLLGLNDAMIYWPYYADLLPAYDKQGSGLKGLFNAMYSDISKEKARLAANATSERQQTRSFIRTGATYPKDKVILVDTTTTGSTGAGTGSTGTGGNTTGSTGTGTGSTGGTNTGGGLGIGADLPQAAQEAKPSFLIMAVVGLFVLFLMFKKS